MDPKARHTMVEVTKDSISKVLSYCPETGIFKVVSNYKYHPSQLGGPAWYPNQIIGSIKPSRKTSYLRTRLCGHNYYMHRLAFLIQTGNWPVSLVDHIDGNGLNNSWRNLRECNAAQNGKNQKLRDGMRFKGVFKRGKKFRAYITSNYITIYLGTFLTEYDAHVAYCEAAKKLHGEFFSPEKSKASNAQPNLFK